MRHPLIRYLLVASLLVCSQARAGVVALTLRPEAKALDTLDWRHATARELKQVTFPAGMPLYASVELGFQEPAARGLPWRLIFNSVQKITVVVSAGGQSRKAYLLVDEQGRGVAIEPTGEDGKKAEVRLAGADSAQGPVAARFGIPISAPMPVDDHVEISIGVALLPSFGRQLFEDLLGAATARARGAITGVMGDEAGDGFKKSSDRALAWIEQTDEQLGQPLVLKRLQACRDSPLTCGGVLGSQVVVVTEADGSAEDFASTHEVRDGQLRVSASGSRYPEFAVFARLQVEPLPATVFSRECAAALEQGAWSGKPGLAERCPVEGLAAAHQPRFLRLRNALERLQSELGREEMAVRVYELASIHGEVCGRGDTQLPVESLPCRTARAVLESKPRSDLFALGEALVKYRRELETLASLPVGGPSSCKQERELRERFQRASQAFLGAAPACAFDADDLPHPLRCGGLPSIESLVASLGRKRGELLDACREQGLCRGEPVAEPALRMTLEAVCSRGVGQAPASLTIDTSPVVAAFEGSSPGGVKEQLDATTTERVLAAVRTRADPTGALPETEVWRTLMATLRQNLDALYDEYTAARQLSDELAEGETAASRQVARELMSLVGSIRADSPDALERTLHSDLEELRRLPHPFARLFKGGKGHFVPVQGAARDIRLGRSALYRRLVQDLDAVRQRPPQVVAPVQQRPPVSAPAG
ncbi:hypothetical protein [Vitiosangium sp. GDMCC 1.1324]|uniref:hypothetical protein n=1 Tax=Vitiosangium sp. (strain GDMCC 1.1324) TaxID=2138576 RepID=UPI000D393C93|nr:hypothetical protein [Vitiosangium sp. GDMCC 1.1324]PTL82768.1 hypothetical protein DAT35_18555 [Vitiosangium sp. GDMCC 1.1324]